MVSFDNIFLMITTDLYLKYKSVVIIKNIL